MGGFRKCSGGGFKRCADGGFMRCGGVATCCDSDTAYKITLPALTIPAATHDLGGGTATMGTSADVTDANPGRLGEGCNLTAFACFQSFMSGATLDYGDTFSPQFDLWFVGTRMYVAVWAGVATCGYATFDGPPDDDGNPTEVDHDPVSWPYTKGIILFYSYVDLDGCCQRTATLTNMLGSVGDTFAATGKVTRNCVIASTGGTMTVKTYCDSCLKCGVVQPNATVSFSGTPPCHVPTGTYVWGSYDSTESLSNPNYNGHPEFCSWTWSLVGVGADGVSRTYYLRMLFDRAFQTWTIHIGDAPDGGDSDHGTYGPFGGYSLDAIECVDGVLTATFTLNDSTTLHPGSAAVTVVIG
jgi:hypothetical protein